MKNKDNQIERVKIIPLGGLEQIGMNITAIEYGDSIVVIDCGMSFPEDDMLGVDFVLPDTVYLEENYSKVKGFVITHGHEDHIGAIPYVFRKINVPIYTTKLTMALIENKLEEHEMLDVIRRNVVNFGDIVTLGDIRVEFIKTNHSIQDAAALALYTPAGVLFRRSSVIRSICSVLRRSDGRGSSLSCAIRPTRSIRGLRCLSARWA